MKYSALLFDLDGTLIHSIELWAQAIQEMFASIGITMTMEDFHALYRPSAHLHRWLEHFNVDLARKEELRVVRDTAYIRLLKEKVTWLPGAKEMLDALEGTVPLGMVTGSWMTYVDAVDARLSVKRYFQTVITEDAMKPFSKPHPHGLLLAADRLGVDPTTCLYVGDMEADVEAAHRAGMPICLVRGKYTSEKAVKEADFTVETLTELQAALRL